MRFSCVRRRCPRRVHHAGIKWLWEIHCQKTGGIIGDEMGLGKTVQVPNIPTPLTHPQSTYPPTNTHTSNPIPTQVAAFLGALLNSGKYKPSLVVCPATMLRTWHKELLCASPRNSPPSFSGGLTLTEQTRRRRLFIDDASSHLVSPSSPQRLGPRSRAPNPPRLRHEGRQGRRRRRQRRRRVAAPAGGADRSRQGE